MSGMDMESPAGDVTVLLRQIGGNAAGSDVSSKLASIVYEELRRLAAAYMRREPSGQTMQATELVHEAYMKLVDQRQVTWKDRAHFFGIAAQLMRRILIDHARVRKAAKRGGNERKVPLEEAFVYLDEQGADLLVLDAALSKLASLDPRQSRIVELRFFGGLTTADIAEVIGIAPRTVDREWKVAQAWLRREMSSGNES
jgi:RNA polymerase sigma factor (TIGR02999 family)